MATTVTTALQDSGLVQLALSRLNSHWRQPVTAELASKKQREGVVYPCGFFILGTAPLTAPPPSKPCSCPKRATGWPSWCPKCDAVLDARSMYAGVCAAGGEQTLRHNAVRDVCGANAGLQPEKERRNLLLPQRPEDSGLERQRPAEIYLPCLQGYPSAIDLACHHWLSADWNPCSGEPGQWQCCCCCVRGDKGFPPKTTPMFVPPKASTSSHWWLKPPAPGTPLLSGFFARSLARATPMPSFSKSWASPSEPTGPERPCSKGRSSGHTRRSRSGKLPSSWSSDSIYLTLTIIDWWFGGSARATSSWSSPARHQSSESPLQRPILLPCHKWCKLLKDLRKPVNRQSNDSHCHWSTEGYSQDPCPTAPWNGRPSSTVGHNAALCLFDCTEWHWLDFLLHLILICSRAVGAAKGRLILTSLCGISLCWSLYLIHAEYLFSERWSGKTYIWNVGNYVETSVSVRGSKVIFLPRRILAIVILMLSRTWGFKSHDAQLMFPNHVSSSFRITVSVSALTQLTNHVFLVSKSAGDPIAWCIAWIDSANQQD